MDTYQLCLYGKHAIWYTHSPFDAELKCILQQYHILKDVGTARDTLGEKRSRGLQLPEVFFFSDLEMY